MYGAALRAYPRVCGGAAIRGHAKTTLKGLSPRVRGSRIWMVTKKRGEGPIPACAGEPIGVRTVYNISGAYPRVCGGAESA